MSTSCLLILTTFVTAWTAFRCHPMSRTTSKNGGCWTSFTKDTVWAYVTTL